MQNRHGINDPPRDPLWSEDRASRLARERATHDDGHHGRAAPHGPPLWNRAAHHEPSGDERWGSGCDYDIDEIFFASDEDLDPELDDLPVVRRAEDDVREEHEEHERRDHR